MRLPGWPGWLTPAVLVLAGANPAARADPYALRLPKGGELCALDNQVVVVGGAGGRGARGRPAGGKPPRVRHQSDLWEVSEVRSGRALIQVRWGGPYGGWYLTCDHRGKQKSLFLSEKPVPGSYWRVGDEDHPAPIHSAARGPVLGWAVEVADAGEEFANEDGHPFPARRVRMAAEGPRFRLTLTAP